MMRSRLRLGLCAIGTAALNGCTVTTGPDEFSIGITIGAGVYLIANAVYAKMRLEDEPSALKRMIAFWCGLPTTFLLFLLMEPSDSWTQRRLDRETDADPDGDALAIRHDFERELARIRAATVGEDRTLKRALPDEKKVFHHDPRETN